MNGGEHRAASLTAGALLRDVLDLLKAHPVSLLGPLVLYGLVSGSGSRQGRAFRGFDDPTRIPLELLPFWTVLGLVAVVVAVGLFLLFALAWLVTTRAALHTTQYRRRPDLADAYEAVRPAYWTGAFTMLIWSVIVIIGLALLVVPGLVLLAFLMPWAAVLVAEGFTGTRALGRAWELTRGHRGDLFLLTAGAALAVLVGNVALAWIPIVGNALAGAATGAVYAALAVLGALYYQRRLGAAPVPPTSHRGGVPSV